MPPMKNYFGIALTFLILVGCAKESGPTLPVITPTVYYKPVIDMKKMKCTANETRDILDDENKILVTLCSKEYSNCLLQGSCYVVEGVKMRSFVFTNKKDGILRFTERRENRCPYGYGVKNICLDPFYSVAADANFHQAGDVIYVPGLVGLSLPDGTQHNGFLIVRDEGGAILGEHRFDFFTGFYGAYDKGNVFTQAGLSEKKNKFGYQKMNEAIAQKVREFRNYPNIPPIF
ncbi:MAG: murein transglycosylase [Proteobacteria bacterium]|nr:MAG: murein transglycosylase [Pseudomonadota bacterium]